MNQFLEQLRRFHASLDARRRWVLWGAVGGTLACLVAVALWAGRAEWQVLLTTSDTQELQATIAGLDESKIPWRVADDGQTLEVPAERIGPARLEAARFGGSVGMELLDDLQMGLTPRREQWAFLRALQGELARTLASLEEVDTARVHLVLPERSAFLNQDQQGTASVTLHLAPGRTLSARQVQGITALVAGAVEGLDPAGVVVVDREGNLLSKSPSEADAAQAGTLLELRHAQETSYEQAIHVALAPVLGSADNLRTTVAVELDHTATEATTDELDPESQAILSEEIREEQATGTRAGGVPGAESNLPERSAQAAGTTGRSSTQMTSNYEYSRTRKHVVQAPGSLKRLSVAVTVNAARIQEMVTASGLTEDRIRADLEATIRAAVPFDAERGDVVQLTFLPFGPEVAGGDVEVAAATTWWRLAPLALVALALVLAFAFVARPVLASVLAQREPEPALAAPVVAEAAEEPERLADRLRRLVSGFETVDAQELNDLVGAHTEASSQVLRQWLRTA